MPSVPRVTSAMNAGPWNPVSFGAGAIVADGEILGAWRPRASGRRLTMRIEPWAPLPARDRSLVEKQAERLAAHRAVTLAGVVDA